MDHSGVISSIKKIATNTYSMRIKPEKRASWTPGQFFLLDFEDDPVGWRAYSIANTPSPEVEFIFRVVGKFTTRASQSKEGTKMKLKGPLGKMRLQDEKKVCFMGGGTGIVPFLAMTKQIYEQNLPVETYVIYTDKKKEFLIYESEWKKMAQKENISVKIKLTREKLEGYEFGHINKSDIPQNADKYFIVGPRRMVEDVEKILQEIGVSKHQIELEKWG